MRDGDYRQELSCRRSVLVNSSVPSESLASSRSHTSEDVLPVPRDFDATSGSYPESPGSTGSIGERAGRAGLVFGGAVTARGVSSVSSTPDTFGAAAFAAGAFDAFEAALSAAADAFGDVGFPLSDGDVLGDCAGAADEPTFCAAGSGFCSGGVTAGADGDVAEGGFATGGVAVCATSDLNRNFQATAASTISITLTIKAVFSFDVERVASKGSAEFRTCAPAAFALSIVSTTCVDDGNGSAATVGSNTVGDEATTRSPTLAIGFMSAAGSPAAFRAEVVASGGTM